MIYDTDFNEVNFTFYLAVAYGLSLDTASFLMNHAGQRDVIRKYVLNRVDKFFKDEKTYSIYLEYFVCKEQRVPLSDEVKAYIKNKPLTFHKDKFEAAYTEFKGLLELEFLYMEDHCLLENFMTAYEPCSYESKHKKLEALYNKFLKNKISLNALTKQSHMNLNTIKEFLA